ncbi:MAG: GH92 family glycosyl hydrolase [Bacteroidales bacterium]|nr:GH92 family glycosyl hydrolase [Bacteroidales bacterium]
MRRLFLTVGLLAGALLSPPARSQSPAELVNTMIGTKLNSWKSGYCVPGAAMPFGMVQFSTPIAGKGVGFGVNQVNAGCGHMANFPMLPMKGSLSKSPEYMTGRMVGISDEKGHAGYYSARVQRDINCEFTATVRTGLARLAYPEGEDKATVLVGAGIGATPIQHAAATVTGPHSFEGYAEGGNFCGFPTPFKVYIYAEFDCDAEVSGIWKDDRLTPGGRFTEGSCSGVYFTFRNTGKPISYKFGISYVSVENAKENLRAENPGWDFDAVRDAATAEWNRRLTKIEVEGTDLMRKIQFYTHLYHAYMFPTTFSDVNGEYPGSDFKTHTSRRVSYTNFSNWDTYRTQIQLLAMLEPEITSDIVYSHYEFARQAGGAFPRWVMGNVETGIMQGDPTSILVANAWAFGARMYEPNPILEIMRRGGEIPGLKCQTIEVRPNLKEYLEKGYTNASLQLEYTSADFAISRFAVDACNDAFASATYEERARSWKNLYNPETRWLQCRDADGNWRPFSKDWKDYDEASYQAYFWMVPYNLKGLVDILGGSQEAIARLDEHFEGGLDGSPFDDHFAGGNEPSFQIPWVYNWTGRPDKTSRIVNRILNELYSVADDGVPGNDDLGTMGAWYVFACMGMYPMIPGVGGFTLNTPVFKKITLHLPGGDVLVKGGSETDIYTSGLRLNGQRWNRAWVDLGDIESGATLEYSVSSKPGKWGQEELPPSFD